jgi:hypothetical protein
MVSSDGVILGNLRALRPGDADVKRVKADRRSMMIVALENIVAVLTVVVECGA